MTPLVMLAKPKLGARCNGCGYCCEAEVCEVGVAAFGDAVQAPCPALVWRDGRSWCGVIEEADKADVAFGGHMRWRLGIGMGCDSDDDEPTADRKAD